jgi:3-hydroxyisobutyrate dehydrogenase-like beta-hydroxyacid dehydrogenase
MASGDKDEIEKATQVFSIFAKKTAYLGQAGAGQAMKLAVNLIVHTLNAAVSEGLALAVAGGISASAAYDVLEESVVAAPFVKYKRAAFLDPELPVAMRIDTVLKDMALILNLGSSLGVPLTAASGVNELFTAAQKAGFDARDMSALFGFIRQS